MKRSCWFGTIPCCFFFDFDHWWRGFLSDEANFGFVTRKWNACARAAVFVGFVVVGRGGVVSRKIGSEWSGKQSPLGGVDGF